MAGRQPNTQMTRDLQTPTVVVDWVTQPNSKILGPSNILEMDQATLFKIVHGECMKTRIIYMRSAHWRRTRPPVPLML